MAKKKHIYFREDTQELKELPITEMNCYYLGEFSNTIIKRIERYLECTTVPYRDLQRSINNGMFK